MKYALLFFVLIGFARLSHAQCGVSNWANSISNDCGDLQPSGGLAPGSPTIFCEGETVTVENNSTPANEIQTTYISWGDGECQTFSGFQNIMTHAYDFPNDTCIKSSPNGTIIFPVLLGVEKTCAPDFKSFNYVQFNVVVRFKPIAEFTASPQILCVNEPVSFNNTSCPNSSNPGYLWNFGDGTTSTVANPPPHTYAIPGTYTVSLQVTNSCSSDTYTRTITVTPPATAAATPADTLICAGGSITFINQSTNAVGYSWTVTPTSGVTFINGTGSTDASPVIRFANPGTYTVRLRVFGCGDPEWTTTVTVLAPASVTIAPIPDACAATGAVTISPTATVGGSSPTVSWEFPGGSPASSSNNPPGPVSYTAPGMYIVTATASNTCGNAVSRDTFLIAPLATADFTPSSVNICGPDELLTLTNSSTNASGYTWSLSPNSGFMFVNGTNANSPNPELKFSMEGSFVVKLVVDGCGTPEKEITVNVRLTPTVSLTNTEDQCDPTVTLSPASLVVFGGGSADSIQWTFLNGSISSFNGSAPPDVTFSGVGTYALSVRVANGCGTQTAIDSFRILPQATAQAMLSDDTLCASGELLLISNSSTNAFSDNPYTWTLTPGTGFNFVNGTSAASAEPQIEFVQEGLYTVSLQVNGCGNPVWTGTVQVILSPGVQMAQLQEGCVDVTLNPLDFTQFTQGTPATISWTFGGGNPATANGPSPGLVDFTGYGLHFIAVTVSNSCGTASAADSFYITEPAQLSIDPAGPFCNTDPPVQLQALPAGGLWSGTGVSSTGLFTPADAPLNTPVQLNYVYDIGDPSCKVSGSIDVLVQGTALQLSPVNPVCANAGLINLSALPPGGDWTGTGVTPAGVFDPALAGPGTHTLTYTFNDMNTGCANAAMLPVTVLGVPTAGLDSIGRVCVDEPLDLGPFTGGSGISTCHWDFGDGTTADICNPVHTYTAFGTYTVVLYVQNTANCTDTATAEIQVVTPPDAIFAIDTTEGCADLPVTITNTSAINDYTLYIWNYGNGQTDTLPQPGTIVYSQGETDTTYLITLRAVNGCGEASAEAPVMVYPRPQVRFGTDVSSGCTPLRVRFNNVSVGEPDFFQWYVNGQLVDSVFELPEQVFLTTDHDSTYYIALVAVNECGADTVVHSVLVKPNPVEAFFNTDTLIGCAPFAVRLIDYSTQGLFISWDLGDGTTATGDTVQHTYTNAGQYLVREFVNNGCGYDTAQVMITVLPAPQVSFSHQPYVCQGDTIFFNNTSTAIIGSYWAFGDGTTDSTLTSTFHVYTAPGDYTVDMTGLSVTNGCPATASSMLEVKSLPEPMVALPDSSGCQPFDFQPVNTTSGASNTYVWDFGDGTTAVGPDGQHRYADAGSFTVRLVVTDFFNCKNDWTFASVQVHPKPKAAFEVSQTALCETPTTLLFTNQSVDADAYLWTFGTLGSSMQVNPGLQVNQAGPLPVRLEAISQYACRDTLLRNLTIYARPEVDFMVADQTGCAPFDVLFEPITQGVNQYAWHFGDGQISSHPSPLHRYTQPGTYTVTLYASADSICFDSMTYTSYITVLPSPEAAFTFGALTDTSIVPNGIYRFFDMSLNANRWHWDFGDGDTSALRNPVHRYYVNGSFPVLLTVFNSLGCTDTLTLLLTPEIFAGLYIPNALAPESGLPGEREFKAIGLGLQEFEIAVFAANGQRVWHSTALVNGQPSEAWNGRLNNNGELLVQGIYYWKARARFENGQIWEGMQFGTDAPVLEGKVLLLR
ncbi:MAG: PKD domain-containing protein [Saprospiraceae bacterium]